MKKSWLIHPLFLLRAVKKGGVEMQKRWIWRLGVIVPLGIVASLLVACTGGVARSEYDAMEQRLTAKEQEIIALQQQLPSKLDADSVEKIANERIVEKLSKVDTDLALWGVQPGTAPRMNEIAHYFNNMWYAAQQRNWLFAEFEVYRTDETVKAIKIVRPKRATGMDEFLEESLEPLRTTVKAKDLSGFIAAYDNAIQHCNECHFATDGGGISLKGVKVTRPTAPIYSNLDYRGNQ